MATTVHRIRSADRVRNGQLETLLSRQDGILRNRRQILRDGLPSKASGVLDEEERSLGAEAQGVGFSVLELTSQTMRGIETALERLEAGEFGTCSDCRHRIAGPRLKAQPFASLCLACQSEHDVAAVAGTRNAVAGWRERLASVRIGAVEA